jgi:hypothetical protein
MRTNRAALDRLLDPDNPSVTIGTLEKAAAALNRRLNVELRRQPAIAGCLQEARPPAATTFPPAGGEKSGVLVWWYGLAGRGKQPGPTALRIRHHPSAYFFGM